MTRYEHNGLFGNRTNPGGRIRSDRCPINLLHIRFSSNVLQKGAK